MSEVLGLIPKYVNEVAGNLSHFPSEFHKILALTLKKSLAQPSIFDKFFLKFALFFSYHLSSNIDTPKLGRGVKVLKIKYS